MSDSLPPSLLHVSEYWIPNHFWSWLFLFLFVIAMIYTAKIVSGEKTQFEQEGKWMQWQGLRLFIPSWWAQNTDFIESVRFFRADTHYDWYFDLSFVKENNLEAAINHFYATEEILLDDLAVQTTEKSYLFSQKKFLQSVKDVFRIESSGSQKEEDRIYLDATWIMLHDGRLIQVISKSSVLNGGIEGPYAEEVLKRLDLVEN